MHAVQPHSHRLPIPSHLKAALWSVALSLPPSSCVNPTVWCSGTGEGLEEEAVWSTLLSQWINVSAVECIENHLSERGPKKNKRDSGGLQLLTELFSPFLKVLQNREVASLEYRLGNDVCSGEKVTEASAVVSSLNMKYITWF